MPRTKTQRMDGNEQVQFYPLPPELNQAVLDSLSAVGSKRSQNLDRSSVPTLNNFGASGPSRPSPGILQPGIPSDVYGNPLEKSGSFDSGAASENMEEEAQTPQEASTSHGPHCKSIPQLSVRHYGGTASQLWALCPDCGAFSKVHEDKPVILCYSP